MRLGLTDEDAVSTAYNDLTTRLGPTVSVQALAPPGIEVALGMVNDSQFGPLIMAAAGGQLVEVLDDRRFALAPFDAAAAHRLLARLTMRPLLAGVRGAARPSGSPTIRTRRSYTVSGATMSAPGGGR